MSTEKPPLFGKTKYLQGQIDEFLDKISEGVIYFEIGLITLIERGSRETCEKKLAQIIELKERCNDLRRQIVTTLYAEMLIPDFRGNVLRLLTDLYALLDIMTNCYQEILIEIKPDTSEPIPEFEKEAKDLISAVIKSVQAVVIASRAFFRDPVAVQDHIYEVRVYESEADQNALRIKKRIFNADLPLELKLQLRDEIDIIDYIADMAEDISDELSIYAIKRAL